MRLSRPASTLLAVAGLLLATAAPSAADDPPPASLLSRFETGTPGNTVDRDGGFSAPIPGTGTSFWLFGDSVWTGGFWFGATAAIGPYTAGLVPTGLTEVPTPPSAIDAPNARPPAGFLPGFPDGLQTPDGQPCTNGSGRIPSSWPTGVATIPGSSRMLITYTDVCQTSVPTIERFVVSEYDPATNTLSGTARVFTDLAGLPPQLQLGGPIFQGGNLYLLGSECHDMWLGFCLAGSVYLARTAADPAQWRDPGSYRFWTGSTWSADFADATSVAPGAKPSSGVYAGDFSGVGKGFVIVESNDIHGGFTVWRSTSLTGGWTATHTGSTPCSGVTEAGLNFCRAHIGHPELSTTSTMLMSYYNPADRHLKVTAVPW